MGGWTEIAAAIGLAVLLAWPVGIHIAKVWEGEPTWLDPAFGRLERLVYKLAGVDPDRGQTWIQYALSFLTFSATSFALLYAMFRLQGRLPLNPQGAGALSPDLAFNLAMGYVTNSDWQSFRSDVALSHFTRMVGLTTENFGSAAMTMSVAAALSRAFASRGGVTLGNFWSDLIRNALYVLLPLSAVVAVALIALGSPQTLAGQVTVHPIEGGSQTLLVGPVASQEAVKQMATSGGGVFNANSAHPFENPNALSNLIEMIAMSAVGFACGVAFGRVVKARSDARSLVLVMALMLMATTSGVYLAERQSTPALSAAGLRSAPNMEGKEVRFGVAGSAGFAAMSAGSSTGATNAGLESFTPSGGGLILFVILLGQTLPGGAGSGLYGLLVMATLAVLVAGLLVGRTPEYLGKRIGAREIKLAMLASLVLPATSLGLAAITATTPLALAGLSTHGPHGLTELLYACAAATANNGSPFAGLMTNTVFWNLILALAMALGRFGVALPVLALAGSLVAKPKLHPTKGTFPTDGPLFVGLVTAIVLILAGLQYFPALALGPANEQFEMAHRLKAAATARAPFPR